MSSFFARCLVLVIAMMWTATGAAQSIADAAIQARQSGNQAYPRSQSFADAAIEAARIRNQPQGNQLPNYPPGNGNTYNWRNRLPVYYGNYPRRCPSCGYFDCRCRQYGYGFGYPYGYGYSTNYFSYNVAPITPYVPAPYIPPPINPVNPLPPIGLAPVAPMNPPAFNAGNRIADRAARLRKANDVARDRADAIIDDGDTLFESQSFHRARMRYSDAVKAAPDYARPHFRLGHVYITLNRFDDALEEYLLALELSGSKDQIAFKLSQLYGANPQTLTSQLEFLSDHALKNPNDGRMLMLIGLTLYYNHQVKEALPLLERASQLQGDWTPYAQRFLPIPPPAALK